MQFLKSQADLALSCVLVSVSGALVSLLGPQGQLAHPSAEQEMELNGAV